MIETLLGSLVGIGSRLIPEVLKFLDAKNERKHELDMQDKALEFQRLKGDQRVDEIRAEGDKSWDDASLKALVESIKGQDAILPLSGSKFTDFLISIANIASKLMRPAITFQWVIMLYPAVIVASFIIAVQGGVPALEALVNVFGPAEKALVSGIVNFWFLDRILKRA